ncbi:hypothetical protein M2272_005694 [Mycobacterium frederiksbergense]|uniref:ScoMcrA-like N-terminal head domain-containing protein n=1 Tax=Mycolicibacterium frederiksbergense TaxID=117567 RepID=A0ABT6L7U6_9MYCO|nr:hypothetical protein [Mycolicibacterium frederiksbergense]MDH6199027.1 hypothetical protein [Mycolicibacterium frederiksbergense]
MGLILDAPALACHTFRSQVDHDKRGNTEGSRRLSKWGLPVAKRDVPGEDVLTALAGFDALGQDAFLAKYGPGKATDYLLHYGGKEAGSKAILAAAYGIVPALCLSGD